MSRGLLLHPPSVAELERLYHELAALGAPAVGRRARWPYRPKGEEELLALAAEMLRFDPRLMSILLHLLLRRWRSWNPFLIREAMRGMRWPQALLVVLEFARAAAPGDAELRHWIDYVGAGWPRVQTAERFFLDAEKPGSRTAQRRLGRNLIPYARWGFIGVERPAADVFQKRLVGRYDPWTRRRIARELAEERGTFSISEYLDAVDRSINRQQALADLKAVPELRVRGHGRGAKWQLRAVS